MKFESELENEVLVAVRDFANAVSANSSVDTSMEALKKLTSNLKISHLDYWERLIRDEFTGIVKDEKKAKWRLPFKPTQRFLTWIDVFNWDGYLRERSLRTLRGPVPNSFFFSLALRRLNDWVPQVRAAARESLPGIVEASDPNHIVPAIGATLSNWESWGRMEAVDKQVLFNILSNESTFEKFVSYVTCNTSGPMASVLSQLGRSVLIDRHLSKLSESAIQPSVRAKAYRSQLEGKMKWLESREWKWIDKAYCIGRTVPIISERTLTEVPDFKSTLNAASKDNSSLVRRVAAELLIQNIGTLDDESSLDYAQKFAADRSSSVSERGRFALRQLGADSENT